MSMSESVAVTMMWEQNKKLDTQVVRWARFISSKSSGLIRRFTGKGFGDMNERNIDYNSMYSLKWHFLSVNVHLSRLECGTYCPIVQNKMIGFCRQLHKYHHKLLYGYLFW